VPRQQRSASARENIGGEHGLDQRLAVLPSLPQGGARGGAPDLSAMQARGPNSDGGVKVTNGSRPRGPRSHTASDAGCGFARARSAELEGRQSPPVVGFGSKPRCWARFTPPRATGVSRVERRLKSARSAAIASERRQGCRGARFGSKISQPTSGQSSKPGRCARRTRTSDTGRRCQQFGRSRCLWRRSAEPCFFVRSAPQAQPRDTRRYGGPDLPVAVGQRACARHEQGLRSIPAQACGP